MVAVVVVGIDSPSCPQEGRTALMMAAKQGETPLVQILLGADNVKIDIQESVSISVCSLIEILALSRFIQSLYDCVTDCWMECSLLCIQ